MKKLFKTPVHENANLTSKTNNLTYLEYVCYNRSSMWRIVRIGYYAKHEKAVLQDLAYENYTSEF